MQIKKEYEIVDEFIQLADSIQAKYPDIFDGIELNKVRCVAITNKTRKEAKRHWDIMPVKMPVKMDCPYNYYIVIFMQDWIEMEDVHKLLLVANAILSIPCDESADEGKVLQPDMKDFAVMLRTFGTDYMDKENVPHLLNEEVKWAVREI